MDTDKNADKIAKLLNQAERAGNEAEAEIFMEAAAKLQAKWAISQAMVDARRGIMNGPTDKIVCRKIGAKGSYYLGFYELARCVGRAHGFKLIVDDIAQWERASHNGAIKECWWHGWESDVEAAGILYTSLMIQAERAAKDFMRGYKAERLRASTRDKFLAKREFLFGFAQGAEARIHSAHRAAVQEHNAETVEHRFNDLRTNEEVDAFDVDKATEAIRQETAIALRSRTEAVGDWYEEKYAGTLRNVPGRSRQYGGGGASSAGYSAGASANIGSGRAVSGGHRALGSGS